MPELPEVEIITQGLRAKLTGLKIENIYILRSGILEQTSPEQFKKHLLNQHITQIRRRGKYILMYFSNNFILSTHLRMTGCYLISRNNIASPKNPYIRLYFDLSHNIRLQYQDKRALGKIRLYSNEAEITIFKNLGVEPFGKEFTLNYLISKLQKCNQQIKPFLLNQKIIAGIGNIYACEILFCAGISPLKKGRQLSLEQIKRLYKTIPQILSKAISNQGTHISDYVDPEGKPGNFSKLLKVYNREKEECFTCGRTIKRIIQQQRSSFYCPTCQL